MALPWEVVAKVLYNMSSPVHHFGVVELLGEVALPAGPQLRVGDKVILKIRQLNTILPDWSSLTLTLQLTLVPHPV
jgi:hypothetical protein